MPDPTRGFTPNEVGALVEGLKSEFRVVAESQSALREDMSEVKERLTIVETRLQSVEDAVKVAIPNHEKRLSRLEAKVGK